MSSKPWYAWFPADYRAKTTHLSFIEDAAYRKLLDAYYERRSPLPCDIVALYRVCGAQGDDEKLAVAKVAKEFFTNGDGSLRHARCDEQIEKEEALRKVWVEAGRKGGLKQAQGRLEGRLNHPTPTPTLIPTPKPTKSKALSGKPDVDQRDYVTEAKEVLEYLNRVTQRNYRPVSSNLNLIVARLKSGVSALQMREVVFVKCGQWGADEKMMQYLRPATLFNASKFEQYLGENSDPPVTG